MNTKSLSLIAAYDFGKEKGLTEDVQQIRTMAIDGIVASSSVRRGYIAHLFQKHNCFDEFFERHWPYGKTYEGQRKLRYYEVLRCRHRDLLSGFDGDGDSADDDEAEDLTQGFALEAHLRDFLAHNLAILEPGLRLYEADNRVGVEYAIDSGRIDILAVDSQDRHVVIELKLSRGRNKALGQLLYYMGWVDQNLKNRPCRGIIVAEDVTPELELAVTRAQGVSLYQYQVSMTVEQVSKAHSAEA